MEQYHIPSEIADEQLSYCLETFAPKRFLVEHIVGIKREIFLEQDLTDKNLSVVNRRVNELLFLLDGEPLYVFERSLGDKGFRSDCNFSVKYERDVGKKGTYVLRSHYMDPQDKTLPPVLNSSILMDNTNHLLTIGPIEGKIPLKFNSFLDDEEYWKYWEIGKSNLK